MEMNHGWPLQTAFKLCFTPEEGLDKSASLSDAVGTTGGVSRIGAYTFDAVT